MRSGGRTLVRLSGSSGGLSIIPSGLDPQRSPPRPPPQLSLSLQVEVIRLQRRAFTSTLTRTPSRSAEKDGNASGALAQAGGGGGPGEPGGLQQEPSSRLMKPSFRGHSGTHKNVQSRREGPSLRTG